MGHRGIHPTGKITRYMGDKEMKNKSIEILKNQEGAIGYIVAWLLGVPASILLLVFLIRG